MATRFSVVRYPHLHGHARYISCAAGTHLRKLASSPIIENLVDRLFKTLEPHPYKAPPRFRRVVSDVSPSLWAAFRTKYAEHRGFKGMTFKYDQAKEQLTTLPISESLRDIARKVMHTQIYTRMRDAQLDSQNRIESLVVTRKFPESSANAIKCKRKPDCIVWTPDYESGTVPTMLWGVISSRRPDPESRAIEWYKRYNGKVGVIIILRFVNSDPRILILELFRGSPEDGHPNTHDARLGPPKTPCYKELVREITVPEKEDVFKDDSIPLRYRDYFGFGNVGGGVDPSSRFDLPLELIRQEVRLVISTGLREQFYASGGGGP